MTEKVTSRQQSRTKRTRRWRLSRRSTYVSLTLSVLVAPLLILIPLRWITPPTTAFILRYEISNDEKTSISSLWTDWEELSPDLVLAVIAAEDQRFLNHQGFDFNSLWDAVEEASRRGKLRGASTISQQVAKNLFLWSGRSFIRKGLEAYLTVWIELAWSKRRILEVYLNIAEFGEGVFGVGAASEYFFGKTPAVITEAEAALLAAVLPNPSMFHVERPSAYVRERQSWIRNQMSRLRANRFLYQLDPQTFEVT